MRSLDWLVFTFLANALWQVPAVAAAAALAARCLHRAPARHRHALWVAALVLAVVLPVASLLPQERALLGVTTEKESQVGKDSRTLPRPPFRVGAELASARGTAQERIRVGKESGDNPLRDGLAAMGRVIGSTVAGARLAVPLPPWARALTLLYLISLLAHGWRLLAAWARTRALRRRAAESVLPPGLAALVADCRAALGLGPTSHRPAARSLAHARDDLGRGLPPVAVLEGPAGVGPLALGALRPAVLVPPGFLESSSEEEVRAVLGHELAHVRRHDFAANLLCEALLLPIAFHPAARLVRRRIAAAREVACDELAVERLLAPRAYARALLAAASTLAGLPRPAATLGVFDADILEERMRRLIDRVSLFTPRRARAALAGGLLLLGAAGWGASALALGVEAAPAVVDLTPFAGTWVGYLEGDTARQHPAGRLTVGAGAVVLELWRLHRNADGSTTTVRFETPGTDVATTGGTLSFRTLEKEFRFRDWAMAPAATSWRFALGADGRGVLTAGENSYFADAKKHGKEVPPPPPPFVLTRQ